MIDPCFKLILLVHHIVSPVADSDAADEVARRPGPKRKLRRELAHILPRDESQIVPEFRVHHDPGRRRLQEIAVPANVAGAHPVVSLHSGGARFSQQCFHREIAEKDEIGVYAVDSVEVPAAARFPGHYKPTHRRARQHVSFDAHHSIVARRNPFRRQGFGLHVQQPDGQSLHSARDAPPSHDRHRLPAGRKPDLAAVEQLERRVRAFGPYNAELS